jgi:hypothetical protein
MIIAPPTERLVAGFDSTAFREFVNWKFSGNFAPVRQTIQVADDAPWADVEKIGVVKQLAGPNDTNRPLLVVVAKVPHGEVLRERSSRLKQFRFARAVLEEAVAHPSPDIDGFPSQGLFAFHDQNGNFRLSLVYATPKGTKLEWSTFKRYSFYVEAGAGNRTFRDRAMLPWLSFAQLSDAFSVEKLTKEFFRRLFDWYQRTMDSPEVVFPNDVVSDKEPGAVKSEQVIRLITRLMFVWFLKQKNLVPDKLFDPDALREILKGFDPAEGASYYRAILQNLFFATLNSEIPDRAFATDGGTVQTNAEHFDIKTLYRYGSEFTWPQEKVLELFHGIPFLNGGLFECLDRGRNYYDGFSRRAAKQAQVPNALFFDEADGLLPLLRQYNFTVEENSPGDEEVALDPELLGKVFENLLAAYNPETNVQARKATGSFYTPREIVNYMVDESLIAHLATQCGEEHEPEIRALYSEGKRPEDQELTDRIDAALTTVRILDPACGSGAFPMGALLRMVEILRTVRGIPEGESVYDLKLELIENAIYGADIQTIAVQISKLRFFISLIAEQQPTDDPGNNYGIHSLPNLETKFVAANSLIGLPHRTDALPMHDLDDLKKHLWQVRHDHFQARSYREKKELRKKDLALRTALAESLEDGGGFDTEAAHLMAAWDPYDQNTSAPFLDPEWMFNMRDGFDVVIGNPPYVLLQNTSLSMQEKTKLVESYVAAQYKVDLYHLFIEQGIGNLARNGCLSYVTPNTFLTNKHTDRLRKMMINTVEIRQLIRFFVPIFYGPSVDNAVFLVRKNESYNARNRNSVKVFDVRNPNRDEWLSISRTVVQGSISPPDYVLVADLCSADLDLIRKIDAKGVELGELAGTYFGIQTRDRTVHVSTTNHGKKWRSVIDGGNVFRYRLAPATEFVHFHPENIKSGGNKTIYARERIVVRQIGQYPEGARCPAELLTLNTIYNIYLRAPDLHIAYLLGVLNSRVIRYYWQKRFSDHKKTFPKIKKKPLESLPIARPSANAHDAVVSLVQEAENQYRSQMSTAKVEQLESEIDQLVYKLYDLTPEEIAIVEESTASGKTGTPTTNTVDKADKQPASPKKSPRKNPTPELPPSLPGWD